MPHYDYCTRLAIWSAQYRLHLERRTTLPQGGRSIGTGEMLLLDLLEDYKKMCDAKAEAISRYKEVAGVLAKAPAQCVSESSRREITALLSEAQKICKEYSSRFDRDPALIGFMQEAAKSINADLQRLKTARA